VIKYSTLLLELSFLGKLSRLISERRFGMKTVNRKSDGASFKKLWQSSQFISEPCESRVLFAVLVLSGTNGADSIGLRQSGGNYYYSLNGAETNKGSGWTGYEISALDADDTISVNDATVSIPGTIYGG